MKLSASLNATTLEPFFEAFEEAASKCDIMIKPVDKKKEKVLLSENRNNLIHQLNETNDSAVLLHLTVLLIYQDVTKQTLHISGKFVPQLIAFLKPSLEQETYDILHASEQLVIRQLKLDKDASSEERDEVDKKLEELAAKLKTIAIVKKSKD